MKRGMKLIAMYIGKFGIFHDEILSFSSDYTVRRAALPGDKISLLIKYGKKIPENFFSIEPSRDGCISSVSAIIGKNGAGKTMIARLFCTMVPPAQHLKKNKIVLICELDGQLVVSATCERNEIEVKLDGKPIDDIRDLTNNFFGIPSAYPFKFFYYSPHYTTEQYGWDMGDDGDEIFNISTTWLMKNPEVHSEPLLPDVSPLTIYDMDEKLRVLGFCQDYERMRAKETATTAESIKNPLQNFAVPLPQGVSISPLFEGMRQVREDMEGYISACHQERNNRPQETHAGVDKHLILNENIREFDVKVGEYLESLRCFWNASQDHQDFFTKVFVFYVSRYLQECGLMEMHSPSFPPSRELKIGSYYLGLKEFIDLHDWNQAVPPEDIINFLDNNPPPMVNKTHRHNEGEKRETAPRDLFKCLRKLYKLINKKGADSKRLVRLDVDGSLVCQSQHKEIGKLVYQLVELHAQTILRSPILSFNIIPKMSSGTMAFLSMFSRLHHFISQNTKSGDHVVVFLDEAETTLHPEWQRKLVDQFIRFFEVFIPDRHYQLVFASHSPMLLSDIPRGNCCFLKSNESDEHNDQSPECSNQKENSDRIKTFGANIYDLYRSAFFMQNGAIGEFSSRVIDTHLKKVAARALKALKRGRNQNNAPDEDMVLVEALIDDRMLVRYFEVLREHGLA